MVMIVKSHRRRPCQLRMALSESKVVKHCFESTAGSYPPQLNHLLRQMENYHQLLDPRKV
jgi:hypothetical protein